jgi:VWFA-related protein
VQINSVDLSAFPEVRATVTVVDGTGRPVAGLASEAFTAGAGNSQLPIGSISSATDAGLGMGVVMVFDTSGSMEGAPIVAAREAGKALVAQLAENDQVAVVAFSDGVRKVLEFTPDHAAATSAIDGLPALGNTALYQAVADSSGVATGSALSRRAVIFLSDGVDFGSVSTLDAPTSLAMVQASGVPYFVVGLGELIDQGYLEQLASASRGRLLLAPGPGDLAALYQDIASILRHQYIVTLDASSLPPGESLSLRIGVTSGAVSGTAETALQVPGEPSPVPTRAPEPTPTRAPVVTEAPTLAPRIEEEEGGSSLAPIFVALALGGVATSAVTGYLLWRRRKRQFDVPEMDVQRFRDKDSPPPAFPAIHAAVHSDPQAYLQLAAGEPQPYPLGDWPVTVGFTSDCSLRLPESPLADSERVRIWRREGRYMLHNLSRMGTVLVAGKPASWAILEDGDEVQIGPVRLLFRDRPPVRQT